MNLLILIGKVTLSILISGALFQNLHAEEKIHLNSNSNHLSQLTTNSLNLSPLTPTSRNLSQLTPTSRNISQLELIIFLQHTSTGEIVQISEIEDNPIYQTAIPLTQSHGFTMINKSDYSLVKESQLLAKSPNTLLLHYGWQQAWSPATLSQPVTFNINHHQYELKGLIHFLNVTKSPSLTLTLEVQDMKKHEKYYCLHPNIILKPNELFYIDHPHIGVLIKNIDNII